MSLSYDDYIIIVKDRSLPRSTRLNALNEIMHCPAPGALKQLLSDEKFLIAITLELHKHGAGSALFYIIYQAFGLDG